MLDFSRAAPSDETSGQVRPENHAQVGPANRSRRPRIFSNLCAKNIEIPYGAVLERRPCSRVHTARMARSRDGASCPPKILFSFRGGAPAVTFFCRRGENEIFFPRAHPCATSFCHVNADERANRSRNRHLETTVRRDSSPVSRQPSRPKSKNVNPWARL